MKSQLKELLASKDTEQARFVSIIQSPRPTCGNINCTTVFSYSLGLCGILVSSPDPTLSRVNSRFLYICFLNASAACVGVLSLFLWVFGYFTHLLHALVFFLFYILPATGRELKQYDFLHNTAHSIPTLKNRQELDSSLLSLHKIECNIFCMMTQYIS